MKTGPQTFKRLAAAHALKKTVDGLLTRNTSKRNLVWGQLFLYWERIVGEETAAITAPRRCTFTKGRESGKLILDVTPEKAMEIRYQTLMLTEKVNRYFGFRAIETLAFKAQKPMRRPRLVPFEKKQYDEQAQAKEQKSLDDALSSFRATYMRRAQSSRNT